MRRDRLQNHVSGSVLTLPTCAVLFFVSWYFTNQNVLLDPWTWVMLLVLVFTAYILIEMNNRNQLLRVRSRMVSSVWLVFVACMPVLQIYGEGPVAACAMAGAYFMLFRTYQKICSEADSFHYGLMLGLSSLFLPKLIFCLPLFLWHQTIFLRSMTLRNLCAVIVGCLFPYIALSGYSLVADDWSNLLYWWQDLRQLVPLSVDAYKHLSVLQIAGWGLVSFLSLLGFLHYLSSSYNDKIQVRMLLYILCFQWFVLETYVCLQPHQLDNYMPVIAVTGAPLTAHYFALTHSWISNVVFILSIIACIALACLSSMIPFALEII